MDWGIVYQLTFFLALGLLAIVVTIFVFAVSQVGRATASSSKEQQDILLQQKKAKAKRIESIERQVTKAKKTGNIDLSKLLSELKSLTEESAEYEAQLRHIQERIMLISRKGAVVCPGVFFLAALALTVVASGLTGSQNLVALPLWIISVGALAFGGFRVFRTLGAIEEVTITSQEAMEKLPEAVKVALRELEEERKPELGLTFMAQQPPFHVKVDSETKIKFRVSLIKGDVADDTVVAFLVPPGFSFPGIESIIQDADHHIAPQFVTARVDYREPVRRGMSLTRELVVKAPSKAGQFEAYYE